MPEGSQEPPDEIVPDRTELIPTIFRPMRSLQIGPCWNRRFPTPLRGEL